MIGGQGRGIGALLASGLVLAAGACGNDDADAEAQRDELVEEGHDLPASPEDTETDAAVADLSLSLTEVASFTEPIDLVPREGDDALFVAEQEGRVYRVEMSGEGTDRTYTVGEEPVVDISDEIVSGGEQGLLGIAFSPDGERLYLSYSLAPDGDTRVISYTYLEDVGDAAAEVDDTAETDDETTEDDETAEDDAAADADDGADTGEGGGPGVDPGSRQEILAEAQPYPNHNGGQIRFGPDGYLYVGLGDGGAGGDPEDNGQDPSTLLGSILRIDPESAVGSEEPYEVPEDNPFVGGEEGLEEVWLYGVRNPWRFSFDAVTGDLWVADVGQDEWEEISLLPADDDDGAGRGANLGWNEMEGSRPYDGGTNPPEGVLPVYEYPIQDELDCAVVGGLVYSGAAIPGLDGAYLFGDNCNPQVRALTIDAGQVTEVTPLEGVSVNALSSIAEDAEDELYFLTLTGSVYRLDPREGFRSLPRRLIEAGTGSL